MASCSCSLFAELYIETDNLILASSSSRTIKIFNIFQEIRRKTPQLSHKMTVPLQAWPANRADAAYKNCRIRLNIDLCKYVHVLLIEQADRSLNFKLQLCMKFLNAITGITDKKVFLESEFWHYFRNCTDSFGLFFVLYRICSISNGNILSVDQDWEI